MECPHLSGGVCAVATELAGLDVRPKSDACDACTSCGAPRRVNYVTASIAVKSHPAASQTDIRTSLFQAGYFNIGREPDEIYVCGPGCHLGFLIKELAGVQKHDNCGCGSLAAKMDAEGSDWCRDQLDWIVQELVNNLAKWIDREEAAPDEPQGERDKLPWWIRFGHRVPGASRMAGKRVVLLAIDRSEKAG